MTYAGAQGTAKQIERNSDVGRAEQQAETHGKPAGCRAENRGHRHTARQTVLDDGVWRTLEDEGETILRAPLAEALCFLWRDSDEKGTAKAWLDEIEANLRKIGQLLGARSPFAPDMDALRRTADAVLGRFAAQTDAIAMPRPCR